MFRAIKLTDIDNDPILVLVHKITLILKSDGVSEIHLDDPSENVLDVKESVDQILKLINNP